MPGAAAAGQLQQAAVFGVLGGGAAGMPVQTTTASGHRYQQQAQQ
jgi:hypothetical protein